MSEEAKTVPELPNVGRFADGFEQLLYWVTTTPDDFDLPRFRSQLPASRREADDSGVSVASTDPNTGNYHVFFSWHIADNKLSFQIDYQRGPKEHESDETEPYAEGFMRWFGQFFIADAVDCHLHVRFQFPRNTRASKFPLSLSAELPFEAEVYGVAFRLPAKPSGASSVRLTGAKVNWYTEVVANRQINFNRFSPYDDVGDLVTVLDAFLERSPA